MEWSVGEPGISESGRLAGGQGLGFMKHRVKTQPSTESNCGLQAYVQNGGKWGYEADKVGKDPVRNKNTKV
jgi:hypothetical protein